METELIVHGVLLPTACAIAVVIAVARRHARWMGVAPFIAFALSSAHFDPIVPQPTFGAWTTSTLSLGLMTLVAALAGDAARCRAGRGIACAIASMLGSLMLTLPEWSSEHARLVLAAALGLSSALLLPPGMHRGGFSFWFAQSLALAGASLLALASGFAKLAVPVGAVSATCGWIGVLALFTKPHRAIHAGLAGSILIAGTAGIAAATAFAFDTGALPWTACVIAGLAPLGCWLGELPPFRSSRVASGLARVLGCAVMSGLVALLCLRAGSPAKGDAYAVGREASAIIAFDPDAPSR